MLRVELENALSAYKGSAMFANKMREASHRILYVTANYSAIMNGISSADKVVKVLTWWQVLLNAVLGVTAVLTLGSLVMYFVKYVQAKKEEKKQEKAQ